MEVKGRLVPGVVCSLFKSAYYNSQMGYVCVCVSIRGCGLKKGAD